MDTVDLHFGCIQKHFGCIQKHKQITIANILGTAEMQIDCIYSSYVNGPNNVVTAVTGFQWLLFSHYKTGVSPFHFIASGQKTWLPIFLKTWISP